LDSLSKFRRKVLRLSQEKKNPEWIARWSHQLRRFADRPWYLWLIALLAFSDLFLLIIPSDFLLVTYVLIKPRRWAWSMFVFSVGSALGAFTLACILHYGGAELIQQWFPSVFESGRWASTAEFVRAHGSPALALISASVLPQQPGVVIAGLSHMPLWEIFAAVLAGRLAKYAVFAWISSHAPRQLERFAWGRAALREVQMPPPRG